MNTSNAVVIEVRQDTADQLADDAVDTEALQDDAVTGTLQRCAHNMPGDPNRLTNGRFPDVPAYDSV